MTPETLFNLLKVAKSTKVWNGKKPIFLWIYGSAKSGARGSKSFAEQFAKLVKGKFPRTRIYAATETIAVQPSGVFSIFNKNTGKYGKLIQF